VARKGNIDVFPQISFAATGESLSHIDDYYYFARTVSSDMEQGRALAGLLEDLGLAPYVSVVFMDDRYSVDLKTFFVDSWTTKGYKLLSEVNINSRSMDDVVVALAESGAPVVVLFLYVNEVNELFEAASKHPVMGTDRIAWIGVDGWTKSAGLNYSVLPSGVVGVLPFNGDTTVKDWYWETYLQYMTSNYPEEQVGPTTTPFVGQLVDAIFAMALSFQETINTNVVLSDAMLRASHFDNLIEAVSFEGVTGLVEFDFQGNPQISRFSVKNYVRVQDLVNTSWHDVGHVVGAIDEENFNFTLQYNELQWPDGSRGKTLSYSQQLVPHCSKGYEPSYHADRYECTLCSVYCKLCHVFCLILNCSLMLFIILFSDYKPYDGPQQCTACSEGMLCNDVGISVPCVESNYWRYHNHSC
jgi:ABC-type branched-subunit amino acid transport system substrate-binding protein